MRIAVAGKGGAGKTTISATLARLVARQGTPVIAIDGDSNPNLAVALGVEPAVVESLSFLPASLVSRRLDGPGLKVPVREVLGTHGVPAPDGVRLVLMGMPGHAGEGCLCSAHATVSALLGDLESEAGTVTVVDMEASPEHLSRGTTRYVDTVLLVTEPYYRSLEAIRRLGVLAQELGIPRVGVVANKVRSPDDAQVVAEFCDRHGLERLGEVPRSDAVVDADLARVPLVDAAPNSPVVAAIAAIADRLPQAIQPSRAPGGA
ncbi:MAG: ArsA-related P-loop ATPase [Acidimicrobiales bacterium]